MRIKYVNSEDVRGHIREFNNFISDNFNKFNHEDNPELILVTGGDGSMLKGIFDNYHNNIPVIGRASGTLNFLLSDFKDNEKDILEGITSDEIKVEVVSATTLSVSINGNDDNFAINEIAIGGDFMDYFDFEVITEDGYFDNFHFRGQGISISTPLGSTGLNLNAEGKILQINDREGNSNKSLSIVNHISNKKINEVFIGCKTVIKVKAGRGETARLYLDGKRKIIELKNGDVITVDIGKDIQIAFLDEREFNKKRIDFAHKKRV